MKKLLSYLLVIALVLVQFMPLVSAAETTGSITINTTTDQTKDGAIEYSIYKIFDLSLNENATAYRYTISKESDWYDFIEASTEYVTLTESDEGTYVVTMPNQKSNSDAMAEFAKAALEYAKTEGIIATETAVIGKDETTVTVSDLELGYYLVDSSLGTLCALTSTNREVTINEKNTAPLVTKEVQEDSDKSWGETNTAQIGDKVNYKTTITVAKGAINYILYDTMENGLTFNDDIAVYVGSEKVAESNYEVVDVTAQSFKVKFKNDYIKSLPAATLIVVEYTATLNKNAEISTKSNDNKTYLTYGDTEDKYKTEEDKTETYTFEFDIVKTNPENVILEGAKFKLYDTETGGNEISVVLNEDGTYRIALPDETGVEIEAGYVTIQGLDANTTYYLEETVAPEGYNKLTSRVAVAMKNANLTAKVEGNNYVEGGVEVENTTGTLLPSTGGMGTVLFITVGSIMVLGFGVLLVTKLRLSKMEI